AGTPKGARMSKVQTLRNKAGAAMRESLGARKNGHAPKAPTRSSKAPTPIAEAQSIPVKRIERDMGQPRKRFDPEKLDQLAAGMKRRGQLRPIRVRWDVKAKVWRIIAGERRWRAAMIAGLETVQAIVEDRPLSKAELMIDQLAENCLRADLEPIEQAEAFKAL